MVLWSLQDKRAAHVCAAWLAAAQRRLTVEQASPKPPSDSSSVPVGLCLLAERVVGCVQAVGVLEAQCATLSHSFLTGAP